MACGEIAVCVLCGEESFFSSLSASSLHGKMRSTAIVPLMQDVLSRAGLNWQDLHALALGAGPGSFTGLRIAAATLAGINSTLKLPIIHLSSLAITARQSDVGESLWVLEDARVGEVFVGHYGQHQAMQADACLNWSDIEAGEINQFCCHAEPPVAMDKSMRVALTLQRSAALAIEVRAVAANHVDQPHYPSPVYLQVSQAERHA